MIAIKLYIEQYLLQDVFKYIINNCTKTFFFLKKTSTTKNYYLKSNQGVVPL